VDVYAFASILFEIGVGNSGPLPRLADTQITVPPYVPRFVSELIKTGLSPISPPKCSFNAIFTILKQNDLGILTGVVSVEVSNFVNWIELCDKSCSSRESQSSLILPSESDSGLSFLFGLLAFDEG
jgi:hypothetical protein